MVNHTWLQYIVLLDSEPLERHPIVVRIVHSATLCSDDIFCTLLNIQFAGGRSRTPGGLKFLIVN